MKSQQQHEISQKIYKSVDKQVISQQTIMIEPQIYRIGNAFLSAEIKKRQNLRLFNGIVIEMLESQIWNISHLDKGNKWKKIISFVKKSLVTRFQYSIYSQSNKILKEISQIDFPNLKEMNLYNAGIVNYQAFTFLTIPHLQYLNIIYNNSPNFKAFNKLNLPSLKVLCIYLRGPNVQAGENNAFYDFSIQDFERWGFNLNEIRLQKSDYDAITMQDFSKLAKSKLSLNNVYYCRINRINQQSIINHFTSRRNINFHISQEAQNQYRLQQMFDNLDIT